MIYGIPFGRSGVATGAVRYCFVLISSRLPSIWALLISLVPDFPRDLTLRYARYEPVVSCNWKAEEDVFGHRSTTHIVNNERAFSVWALSVDDHPNMR